jgi:hypothetical protein
MIKRFFALFFIFILTITFIIYKNYSVYHYDTKKDYLYNFNNATVQNITLKNSSLTLKAKDKTAFLEVDIDSNFMGKVFHPSIEIYTKIKSVKSYFELSAKGKRYINISSFLDKDVTTITLKPNFLTIKKSVKVILYKNPNLKDKKILIIAPHPDDAEIASYGLYSTYNKNSFIVTITAGDAGENNYKNIYHDNLKSSYLEKAKLRILNSSFTPLIGGIKLTHTINLCYFDGTLKELYLNKNKSLNSIFTNQSTTKLYRNFSPSPLIEELNTTKNSWNSLVSDLTYLIKKISPDIIITPHPKLDAHPDHIHSTLALFEALKKSDKKGITLFLYTNHNLLSEVYPYGKANSTMDLPPYFEKLNFNSIYSFNLSPLKQKDKIVALESMNDLRPSTQWQTFFGNIKMALRVLKHKILGDDESYFRRAIRENEIFFIYTQSSLKHTFE